jgi:hypothetical protein
VSGSGSAPAWYMRGSLVGACNCDWGCPCNFDAPPTYGFCDGFYGMVVHEGRFGEVVLDGARFVWGGHAPGAIHEGEGTSVLILDTSTTLEQRAAIDRLWRGGGVGSPFDEFASVTTLWHEPIVADVEVSLAGIHSTVRVTGDATFELAIARIRNPVTGDEEELYLDKPTGFTSKHTELGMSTVGVFASPGMSFDVGGKYAEYAEFEYSGP